MPAGKVFLVGAGPGDPALLTVKAAKLLQEADVVVVDALVSPAILRMIAPGVRVVDAGKRASRHTLPQETTNQILVDEAKRGNRVVRLKGGDPFVFGRGGEEAEELSRNGVDFEVVPGISSAIAGPAYAGIPVTHRSLATSVSLITGHESDESSGIDWERLAASSGTLVFLMGLGRLSSICEQLVSRGMNSDMPVAVIAKATTAEQRTVTGTLATIAARVQEAELPAPALVVVGRVVALRESIEWFEKRPLFGRRIVVTRAREQASDLRRLLEDAGAIVLEFPMIEIAAPSDSWASLDSVIDRIGEYDRLVFTSTNGVAAFFERLFEKGRDARALARLEIAAVGETTASALRTLGLAADLVPEKFQSAALLPLLPEDQSGVSTAVVRAASGRDELIDELRRRGGRVDLAVAYETKATDEGLEELRALLSAGSIDCVTFTSSSTVTNLFERLGADEKATLLDRAVVASIGPSTSETLRRLDVPIGIEAPLPSIAALVDAVIAHYRRDTPKG